MSADYSLVDAAIEKANELGKELYSNYDVVTAAIEAVDHNKSKAEQAEVDAMAQAIEDAIAALEYRAADYTAVDAAIAKAEALNPENYTDFSAVETAVSAVTRGLDITHQAEVDAMAQAIEDAIAALKPVGTVSGDESSDAVSDTSSAGDEPSDTPSTGDAANVLLWGGLLVLAMLGGVLVCRRAKQ